MLVTTQAIVLRAVAHGDRTLVLKAWTRRGGVRSYVVRTGRRGASAAVAQPLSRVELVADEHPERDLHAVREIRVDRPYLRIPYEPIRGAVALFTQELLLRTLRTESPDPVIDAVVEDALEAIDSAADLRCLPLVLLIRLSAPLGFLPAPPMPGEDHFDLQEGCFMPAGAMHGHLLAPPLSMALAHLLQAEFADLERLRLPAQVRRDLMDHLLLYYRMHVEGLGELRSPAVLHAVLS